MSISYALLFRQQGKYSNSRDRQARIKCHRSALKMRCNYYRFEYDTPPKRPFHLPSTAV